MKKILLLAFALFLIVHASSAQLLTWTPSFSKDTSSIDITMDATRGNGALMGFSGNVYVHIGLITSQSTSSSDWKYVKFTWATADPSAQATAAGANKWSFSITNIRNYFNVPSGESILRIAVLFRNGSGSVVQRNTDGSDMYIPVYGNSLALRFTQPPYQPLYQPVPEPITKVSGDNITLQAECNLTSTLKLFLNGTEIQNASNATSITANPTLTQSGNQEVVAEANDGTVTRRDTLHFFVSPGINIAALPAGVRDGLNFETGDTSLVLVLYAPGKNRVSVIGEFPGSNWTEQSKYVMNKTPDGNRWWLRVTGLTAGTEYAFQYLVDGTLKTTDPYVEKILDPANDPAIPPSTYPGLKPYPSQASGIVGIVQTARPVYNWSVPVFTRPDQRGLAIYELLLRDFLAAHDWKTLTDTLDYLHNLGIGAIEVMPFNEFENNDSWGYNPDFFFAADKYYGPANDVKRFIDSCHRRGIAVIMDMVLNHATGLCPLAALYWDGVNNRPAANNPWFNPVATHPFNVFNDFNHESAVTKYFVERVTAFWLKEYKLDGFRFDLSKGFTQKNSGSDVNAWSAYDASRVAIWKTYYDSIQAQSPGAYVILEHFADNTEEKELADYGMMLWGNMNYNYNEASMGYVGTSNFENGISSVRGWTNPYLVTYMESHDEERLMYKNLQFGNASGTYNTRSLNTALRRVEMCAAFFIPIPGPKMVWQFGELGYDYSINYCPDGTINNNCRVSAKPVKWDYLQTESRRRLRDIYASLFKLRQHPAYRDAFLGNTITQSLSGAIKWIKISADTSNLLIVGNFDVTAQTGAVTFQHAGTWYEYLKAGTITATGASQNMSLEPGEYHVFADRNITNAVTTPVTDIPFPGNRFDCRLLPNLVSGNEEMVLKLELPKPGQVQIAVLNLSGQTLHVLPLETLGQGSHNIMVRTGNKALAAGTYVLRVQAAGLVRSLKFVIY